MAAGWTPAYRVYGSPARPGSMCQMLLTVGPSCSAYSGLSVNRGCSVACTQVFPRSSVYSTWGPNHMLLLAENIRPPERGS